MPPSLSQSSGFFPLSNAFPSSQKGVEISSVDAPKMVEKSNLDDLPEPLLMEVLSRLPVKSLLQLKCVCKNWYALIHNPFFVSIHYQNHSKDSHLLVHRHDPHTGDSELSFLHSSSPIMPNPHQDSDLFSWEIVGPSKGLFLLYNHQEEAAVWNPGTREFRLIIRGSGFPYSDSLRLFSQAFGFGADPVSNEYKVVRVSDFWDNSTDSWHNPIVSVYSLGTDSWRHFDFEGSSNLRARNMVKSCGTTFLDGCFYWKSVDNRSVFVFDMRKEEFQEIKTPELFKSKQGDLALYGGCVAMFFHDFVDKTKLCVDIWAMDSGKRWGMKVRIGPFVSIRRPLGYGENGEIFLENALSKVAVVEAAGSREAKVFGPMKGLQGGCLSGLFDYKESLVSIKPTTNKHLFSNFLDF
nr:F-box/kelch-repeat protein At3g06240-like isoform X1 [Ipomoea batatas]